MATKKELRKNLNWKGDDKNLLASVNQILDNAIIYAGQATIAELNAIAQEDLEVGEVYTVTDTGTLTYGSLVIGSANVNVMPIIDDGDKVWTLITG